VSEHQRASGCRLEKRRQTWQIFVSRESTLFRSLGIEGDEAKRQAVARFIIRLAREDASFDAAELRDKAVAALGGVAYLAIAQAPQPSLPRPSVE
jgi:hypothetical protein